MVIQSIDAAGLSGRSCRVGLVWPGLSDRASRSLAGAESFIGHLSFSLTRCQGLAPWSFKRFRSFSVVANVKLHGASPWHLQKVRSFSVVANVKPHGASPWHLQKVSQFFVVANVKLHGASPWHLQKVSQFFCSRKREAPRGKPVASSKGFAVFL